MPQNCTDQLQPLELSVNKLVKDFLRGTFQHWYSDKTFDQHEDGLTLQPVTFPMDVRKPLGANWLMEFYSYMQDRPDIVLNGFHAAEITDLIDRLLIAVLYAKNAVPKLFKILNSDLDFTVSSSLHIPHAN